jgi:cytochrome c biogenesis protein ResB
MRQLVHWLGRPQVAAALILLALAAAALGSFFPQRPTGGLAAPARWEEAAHARYGALAALMDRLGLFRWYTSPVLWVALALPVLATILCTLNRWPDLGPRLLRPSAPHWGTLITHLTVPLFLLALALSGLGRQEEVTLAVGETGTFPSANLALRCDAVNLERYSDGSVADYKVEVTVLEDGREVRRGTVRPNLPLSLGRVAVFLYGYAVQQGQPVVTLRATSDPGYVPFLVGGGLFLLGLILRWTVGDGRRRTEDPL